MPSPARQVRKVARLPRGHGTCDAGGSLDAGCSPRYKAQTRRPKCSHSSSCAASSAQTSHWKTDILKRKQQTPNNTHTAKLCTGRLFKNEKCIHCQKGLHKNINTRNLWVVGGLWAIFILSFVLYCGSCFLQKRWFNRNVRVLTKIHADSNLTNDCFWDTDWKGTSDTVWA